MKGLSSPGVCMLCVVGRGKIKFVLYIETILPLVWRLVYKKAKKENRKTSLGTTKITM